MTNPPSILNWLNGQCHLGHLRVENIPIDYLNGIRNFWLLMRYVAPVHEANMIETIPLSDSFNEHKNYLDKVKKLINQSKMEYGYLSIEDSQYITNTIGQPPNPSLPIYIVTVEENDVHRIVYIGKTTTSVRQRFSQGHAALSKLLDPKYNGKCKNIFFCELYFGIIQNFELIPIDFAENDNEKRMTVSLIETMLINAYNPELNTMHMNPNNPPPVTNIDITIENQTTFNVNIPIHTINDTILRNGRSLIGQGY